MLINGMYRNKMYGCKTKPESPTAQSTTDQTQIIFLNDKVDIIIIINESRLAR